MALTELSSRPFSCAPGAAFRQALLQEALEVMLAGDLAIGEAALRDYIDLTLRGARSRHRHAAEKA